jgi:peroxiredoxin/outer membrane lipoprotein-sorting protein
MTSFSRRGLAAGSRKRRGAAAAKRLTRKHPNVALKYAHENFSPNFGGRMRRKLFLLVAAIATLANAQTTQPTITPAARSMLDQMRTAYAALKSLDVAGTITFDLDAGGRKDSDKAEFTASFQSPAKFRHEMKDDVLLISNGEKGYIYVPGENKYRPIDPPTARTAAADLPPPLGDELQQQNPSLVLALSTNAASELSSGATALDREPDMKVNGISYQMLQIQSEGQMTQVLVDPQTHLIRQVSIDLRDHLVAKGVPQVKQAMVKIDYTKTSPNVPLADAMFTWSPPSDATLVKQQQADAGDPPSASAALVGKPAPLFTLKDLKDQDVALAAQKGHVVVLDIWATWCGPCVVELPTLDKMSQDLAASGVKFFAVNQAEPKDTVQNFLDKHKLSLPVLLDEKGTVSQQYQAQAIPQTVVIAKDGTVAKVFVGFGPDSEQKLREAINDALK